MVSRQRTVDASVVRALAQSALAPAPLAEDRGQGGVGLEMEWLVYDRRDRDREVTVAEVQRAIGDDPFPSLSVLSFEPGGQVELSTRRCADPVSALAALDADAAALFARLQAAGLHALEVGIDPVRPPRRSLHLPRYVAMEAAFDARGPEGRVMMCSTASLQINLDFGPDPWESWVMANALGPVLLASFANSPVHAGRPSGFASTRSHVWSRIDPSRTRPVRTETPEDWVDYVLDANVLLIRSGGAAFPITEPFSLRDWVDEGHPLGFPEVDDVAYHLTTLFPPVRPRTWLELRMIDAGPAEARAAAVAVAWSIVTAPEAFRKVREQIVHLDRPWESAALGLSDPRLLELSIETFETSLDDVRRRAPALASAVEGWLRHRLQADAH